MKKERERLDERKILGILETLLNNRKGNLKKQNK